MMARTTCTAAWIFTGTVSGRQNMRRALIRFRLRWKARTAIRGYPGNASIRVTYTLTDENEVKIHYEGTCDQDTIFNMTNHAYFNLAGHESGPALSQMVYIDSDAITAVDKVLIPTGEIRKVMGTPMDFSDFKPIGRDIEADYDQLKLGGGYDHNWILNHESGVFSLAAAAIDEESGRKMEVYTDLPGVQFYTGNFLDGRVPGKGGVVCETPGILL